MFLFLALFPCCSQLSQLVLKNLIILEFPKNMIKPPLLWLMFLTLQDNFRIMLRLMKSNGPLLNALYKNDKKATFYISELIITLFSPFDVKCEKRNAKNLQESESFIFSQGCTGLWVGEGVWGGCPPDTF